MNIRKVAQSTAYTLGNGGTPTALYRIYMGAMATLMAIAGFFARDMLGDIKTDLSKLSDSYTAISIQQAAATERFSAQIQRDAAQDTDRARIERRVDTVENLIRPLRNP